MNTYDMVRERTRNNYDTTKSLDMVRERTIARAFLDETDHIQYVHVLRYVHVTKIAFIQ